MKRLLIILSFVAILVMALPTTVMAQTYDVSYKNQSLELVTQDLRLKTGYAFVYKKDIEVGLPRITCTLKNVTLEQLFNGVFSAIGLDYEIAKGKTVVLKLVNKNAPTQSKRIRGIVTDQNGEALLGATVVVKGKGTGVVTDANGQFNIEQKEDNCELEISYVGMKTQTVRVSSKNNSYLNIKLDSDVNILDDVIIVGYGQQARRNLTGSVAKVKGSTVESATQDAPILALQGHAAGVYVTQGAGLPGGGLSQIIIRGFNSMGTTRDKTKPLYIVDGVPLNSNPQNPVSTTDTGLFGLPDALSFINPSDIESIDILKDADATAIYGTRGSNGVVLITTKKGKQGKVRVNLQLSSTAQWAGKRLDFLSTEEYLALRRKAFDTDKALGYSTDANMNVTNFPDLLLWDQNKDYDWQDLVMGNTAWATDGKVNISGGNRNTSFLISGSYYKSGTVTIGDDQYKRFTGHANVMHKSDDDRLTLEAGFTVSRLDMFADAGSTAYSYLNTAPNTPPYDDEGKVYWIPNSTSFTAPLQMLNYTGENKADNLIANFTGNYKIWKELAFKLTMGYEHSASTQNILYERNYYNPFSTYYTNQATYYSLNTSILNIEPQITYQTELFGGDANFLLGATYQSGETRLLYMTGADYPSDMALRNATAASRISTHSNPVTQTKTASAFARFTYNYQSRYLFNAVARRDGSSRFGSNYRYGNFYSLGAGWIFSNEKFVKEAVGEWLSHGKLRISYGKTGNDNISDYAYITKYAFNGYPYEGHVGLAPSNLANEDLHWETTKKFDLGLELGFLNDRILLNITRYRSRSTDLLTTLSTPAQTGFTSISINQKATIDNKGVELELNTHNIKTKDFNWNTSFNMTFPKNELVDYPDLESSSYYNTYRIGESINLVRGYKYLGVNKENGLPEVEDVNKDERINSTGDYQTIGTRDPKFYGGLTNIISYKDFTLDFTFYFRKMDYQNGYLYLFYTPVGMMRNVTRDMATDYWTTPGQEAKNPRITSSSSSDAYRNYYNYYTMSDAAYSSGSYIRLSNVKLSYNVPKTVIKPIGLNAMQLYLQAKNLFTISNYDGYNPETGNALPPLTSFTFGLNVTF
ncbi:MAG: TonB-dependent receptor [Prevotella sp.]|nr:TonB-dependent receptor [Prevotella sp.]